MRAHQQLLQMNNWSHIQSEVLVSTPRRFGKTISVSMFAAAMLFACTGCEIRSVHNNRLRMLSPSNSHHLTDFYLLAVFIQHAKGWPPTLST
jgi:hypothetical protein